MAILFHANDHPGDRMESDKPANGTDFQLEELQKLVGGYIQIVALGSDFRLVIDEDGRAKKLKANNFASMLLMAWYAPEIVVGPALLCETSEIK